MRLRISIVLAALALVVLVPAARAADPAVPAYGGPLSGSQEVPAVAGSGTGDTTVVISADGSRITYVVTYSGLSGPVVAAHIHTGAAGTNGGVILPLTHGPSPMVGTLTAANFTPSGAVATFGDAVAAIRAGTAYVNLHTAAYPSGEVRAQLLAKGDAYAATLTGFQEVPAVTTGGSGSAWVVISADQSTLTYVVTYSGLSGAVVAAHIHAGAVGANGGVALPLTHGPSPMVGTLTAANLSASGPLATFADAVAAIRAGGTYINLHTAANPGGEIRGQVAQTVAAPAPTPTAAPTDAAPTDAAPEPTPPPTSSVPASPSPAALSMLLAVLGLVVGATGLALARLQRRG
ncbi:MAG TPA: CHRD domain-containing protein [Candidatus Limnocylindrales bacterium]|nr:CHRD domain-containing protein [Candidatus Limnocylindrales bacterium]